MTEKKVTNKGVELFIELLEMIDDKEGAVVLLQQFIQEHGPIPDEYGDRVRDLLSR